MHYRRNVNRYLCLCAFYTRVYFNQINMAIMFYIASHHAWLAIDYRLDRSDGYRGQLLGVHSSSWQFHFAFRKSASRKFSLFDCSFHWGNPLRQLYQWLAEHDNISGKYGIITYGRLSDVGRIKIKNQVNDIDCSSLISAQMRLAAALKSRKNRKNSAIEEMVSKKIAASG